MELIRSLKGIFSIFSSYSQVMDGNMNVGKLISGTEKYKIESKSNLKELFSMGKLKETIETEFKVQDTLEKATLSEAQPELHIEQYGQSDV